MKILLINSSLIQDAGPAASPVAETPEPAVFKPRSRPARKARSGSSGRRVLGMTPQQRMVLSIFLFLDVAVIGFLILLAIGAINF